MAFVTARIVAAVDAALASSTHVQLHTGAPGGSGTSNVAVSAARAAITWGSDVGGVVVGTATWTITAAEGPYTNFSLWTAITAGTFYGSGTLTPNETFAGAGTLALTATVTGTST